MGATGGYGCEAKVILARLAQGEFDPAYRRAVEEMVEFWKTENTQAKHIALWPPEVKQGLIPYGLADGSIRLAGCNLDFDTLLRQGLPGMRAEVEAHQVRAAREGGEVRFYEGLLMAVDLVVEVFHWYAAQARELAETAEPGWGKELRTMAAILEKLTVAPPETLREAIQLYWLYAQVAQLRNHGRMDVYLGDFYANDRDAGRITEAEALRLVQSVWWLIVARWIRFDSRVIVGGKGRRNEANADRFALLAMEATRTVEEVIPQLTLRHYRGQNPALMQKALDVMGEGRTFPMLYNDDVNIPAVQHAFGVSEAAAEQYLPYGCGEYTLDHMTVGSPNCALCTLKALDAALRNGRDGLTGKMIGLETGEFRSFETFEQFFEAYSRQVEHGALAPGRAPRVRIPGGTRERGLPAHQSAHGGLPGAGEVYRERRGAVPGSDSGILRQYQCGGQSHRDQEAGVRREGRDAGRTVGGAGRELRGLRARVSKAASRAQVRQR